MSAAHSTRRVIGVPTRLMRRVLRDILEPLSRAALRRALHQSPSHKERRMAYALLLDRQRSTMRSRPAYDRYRQPR